MTPGPGVGVGVAVGVGVGVGRAEAVIRSAGTKTGSPETWLSTTVANAKIRPPLVVGRATT
jgi:hypothetical protein